MLYTAFIAICLIGMSPKECDRHSATSWVVAPENQAGLAACMIHGQQYAAESRLVEVGETYAKVYCRPVAANPVG